MQQKSPPGQSASVWHAVIMHSVEEHQLLLTPPVGKQQCPSSPQSSGPSHMARKSPEHMLGVMHSCVGGVSVTQQISGLVTAAKLGADRFGMIATTRLPLSAGVWEFTTLSDDGIRVIVDERAIIDNWTWHGPTRDTGTLNLPEDRTVEIRVEHFEIDGFATLELKISRPLPLSP